jgi:hypothetical protein
LKQYKTTARKMIQEALLGSDTIMERRLGPETRQFKKKKKKRKKERKKEKGEGRAERADSRLIPFPPRFTFHCLGHRTFDQCIVCVLPLAGID